MGVYLVSYDLRKQGQDYKGLIDALKIFESCKILYSTWLVSTENSAEQIFDQLRPYIDDNDYLLVIKVTSGYKGLLATEVWNWVKSHL